MVINNSNYSIGFSNPSIRRLSLPSSAFLFPYFLTRIEKLEEILTKVPPLQAGSGPKVGGVGEQHWEGLRATGIYTRTS